MNATRGLHRLQAVIEIVNVDLEKLAVGDRRQRLRRLAGQVGHDSNDERKLDLLLGAVGFDIVFDLNAGARFRAMNFWLLALATTWFLPDYT